MAKESCHSCTIANCFTIRAQCDRHIFICGDLMKLYTAISVEMNYKLNQ